MTPLEGPITGNLPKMDDTKLQLFKSEYKPVKPKSPFNLEALSFDSVQARIGQLTAQAKAEIALLAEKALPIQSELASAEQKYIDEENSKDLGKAISSDEIANVQTKLAEHTRIYQEEATAEVSLSQINEMTKEAQLPELSSKPTLEVRDDIKTDVEQVGFAKCEAAQKYLLGELNRELDLLSKEIGRRNIISRDLEDTMKNIVATYSHLTGTGTLEDIHLALRTKMLYSVLQDRKSDKLLTGNHGGPHVLDWDTRVGVDIGRDMGMKPEEELQFRYAANFHDVGYTLPSVDGQLHAGNYWIDRRHETQGAKVLRELWERNLFRGLFKDPQSLASMHDAILNHAKIDIFDLKNPSVRIRNVLIAADLAAVFDRKIPYAYEAAPGIMLGASFKIKAAKENFPDKANLASSLDKIKREATEKAQNDINLSEYARSCILESILQLCEVTPDVLIGRFGYLEDIGHCGYDPQGEQNRDGSIYFLFTRTGYEDIFGHSLLLSLFGRKSEGQKHKSASEFEAVEDPQNRGKFISPRGIRIEFRDSKPEASLHVTQEKIKMTLNLIYSYNRDYMTVNNMLRQLIDPTNPEALVNALIEGTDISNLPFQQLKVLAGSHFFRNGNVLDRENIIHELRTDKGKADLVQFLYAKRTKIAERILNNPKI